MPKGSGVTTPSAQRKVVRYLVTCPDTNSTPGVLSQHRRVPKARKWYNAIATADAEICSFGGKWKFARLWSVQGIFVTLLSGQRQQLTKTSFGLIRPLLAEKGQRPRKLDSRLGLRLSPGYGKTINALCQPVSFLTSWAWGETRRKVQWNTVALGFHVLCRLWDERVQGHILDEWRPGKSLYSILLSIILHRIQHCTILRLKSTCRLHTCNHNVRVDINALVLPSCGFYSRCPVFKVD